MADRDVAQLKNQVKTLEKQVRQLGDWKKATLKFLDQEQKRMIQVEKTITMLDKRSIEEIKRYNKSAQFLAQEKKRVDVLETSSKKTENEDLLFRTKHNNSQLVKSKKVIDGLSARISKLEKSMPKS